METPPQTHLALAADLFNRTWELLDTAERSPELDDELVAAAFASKYHWTKVPSATAENLAIADNQVARAACEVGLGDVAVRYARLALDRSLAEGWSDWRLASAFEISARAAAVTGDRAARDAFVQRASGVLETVDDEEDRAAIQAQLDTVP